MSKWLKKNGRKVLPVKLANEWKLLKKGGVLNVDRFEKFESAFERPWQPDYKASMLQGIVGIDVEITGIQCKYKLSQNRSQEDQSRVTKRLQEKGSHELARAMNVNER